MHTAIRDFVRESLAAPVAANAKSSVAASGPVPKAAAPSVAKPPSQVVDSGAVQKAAAPIVAQPSSPVAASAQATEARPSQKVLTEEEKNKIALNKVAALAQKEDKSAVGTSAKKKKGRRRTSLKGTEL